MSSTRVSPEEHIQRLVHPLGANTTRELHRELIAITQHTSAEGDTRGVKADWDLFFFFHKDNKQNVACSRLRVVVALANPFLVVLLVVSRRARVL